MIEKVKGIIHRYAMLRPGETVVVGVSGGPDSTALLHVLYDFRIELGLELIVACLDHQVRRDSARDFDFVKKMSERSGLVFYGRRLDRTKIKKTGSLEDQLRRHRYAFFSDVCQRTGAKKICLGHTMDDQAETVLMRILRGSGLYGLSAIVPKRTLDDRLDVVRPLISVTRKEVLAYLKKRKISYRIDPTNRDDAFLRNRIRHDLLPRLQRSYNPNIKEALANLALTVGADYAFLAKEARQFFKKTGRPRSQTIALPLEGLKHLDVAILRVVFRLCLEEIAGNLKKMELRHLQEVEDMISGRFPGGQVHLPQGLCVEKTSDTIKIFKR